MTSATEQLHTAGPYKFSYEPTTAPGDPRVGPYLITGKDQKYGIGGFGIAEVRPYSSTQDAQANAAFIAHTMNSFDVLRAALNLARCDLAVYAKSNKHAQRAVKDIDAALEKTALYAPRAALKKAGR